MATYDSPSLSIPTEYVPFDYTQEVQLALAQAQQAAVNIAKVKSRYEDLIGLDLTTNKSKETLSAFGKSAEENLQKVAGMNMMVYDNAKQALKIFDPLTDPNGEYSFIMGDHAVTQLGKSILSQIERSKTENKGADYNRSLEEITNYKLSLFSKQNKPENWKYTYSNMGSYIPGYDEGLKKELSDLTKQWTDIVGDGMETDKVLGNGYIETVQDKSINSEKFREFLDTHLSDRAKEQMRLNTQTEYWRNLYGIESIQDPQKKQDALNKIKANYTQMFQADIDERLANAQERHDKLEMYKKIADPSDVTFLSTLNKELSGIDGIITTLKGKKITDEDVNPLLDVDNWARGEQLYSDFAMDKELTKIANATAMAKGKLSFKEDQAYFASQKLSLDWAQLNETKRHNLAEEGLKQLELSMGIGMFGAPNVSYDPVKGTQTESTEKSGEQALDNDVAEVANSKQSFGALETMMGQSFDFNDKDLEDLQSMTYAQAVKAKIIPQNDVLNALFKSIRKADGKSLDPEKDNATSVLQLLKAASFDQRYIDAMAKTFKNNDEKRKAFNIVRSNLEMMNSLSTAVQGTIKEAASQSLLGLTTNDGKKYFEGKDLSSKEKINAYIKAYSLTFKNSSEVEEETRKKFYDTYYTLSSSKEGMKNPRFTYYKTNEKTKGAFQNTIIGFSQGAEKTDINTFVLQYSKYAIGVIQSNKGYGVEFSPAEMTEADGKSFLAAYNAMAEKDEETFKPATSVLEAVNNLNSYFATNSIPTNGFNMSDPKYNADPHSIYLQQGIPISVVNVSESQLNNIYKLNLQKKVYVTIENTHPRGGNESARIAIKANYVMPKMDKNNNFVRDANGNIVIDYKDGNYLKNYYIAQKMKDNGITNKDVAERLVDQDLMAGITQRSNNISEVALGYLDLINYLNTDGKSEKTLTNSLYSRFL
jgi:hypothetical protein